MASLSKEQNETLALIDAILAMSEKNPGDGFSISFQSKQLNVFDFVLNIITKKVSFDEMLDWLVNFITKSLPLIELGIKGVLLSNLKATVDCLNDPRIPYWMRKQNNFTGFTTDTTNLREDGGGIVFNIKAIDYRNILSVSPLSPEGSRYYFGNKTYYTIDTDKTADKKYPNYKAAVNECKDNGISLSKVKKHSECDNVHQLVRAEDFNAFLWYVVHKGYFANSEKISENNFKVLQRHDNVIPGNSFFNETRHSWSIAINSNEINNYPTVTYSSEELTNRDNSADVIAYSLAPRKYACQIVPCSSDEYSVNWYCNSGTFFNFLKPDEMRVPRNYDKDYPICNLQYIENYTEDGKSCTDGIRFSILPKPKLIYPKVFTDKDSEPSWKFKRALYNADGEPDQKGCFSSNGEVGDGTTNVSVDTLYPCYKGLTVYEFNYDFVMGMQLFESTVFASQLLDMVTNLRGGLKTSFNFGINKSETAYQMRIAEIVKNIVESTAYEVSDCFYSFDNAKYDAMLRDAELKRSRLRVYSDGVVSATEVDGDSCYDILNEFDSNATLNENKEVIKRAITQATASITEEILPEDQYSVKFNIVADLIKVTAQLLIEGLLTPKLILLFEVNRTLMGQDYTIYNIEDFLKSIQGLLVAIVREIRDMILQQLIDWCMRILSELFEILKDLLIKEQLEYYRRLINALLKACSFSRSGRKPLQSELDNVDYADIDEIERPLEANC